MVSMDAEGLIAKSLISCILLSLPMVDISSDSMVMVASSVSARNGLILLTCFFCLILFIWLFFFIFVLVS